MFGSYLYKKANFILLSTINIVWLFHYESWSPTGSLCVAELSDAFKNYSRTDICMSSGLIYPFSWKKNTFLSSQSIPFHFSLVFPYIWVPPLLTACRVKGLSIWKVFWVTSIIQFPLLITHDNPSPKTKQMWGLIDCKQGWDHPEKLPGARPMSW